jgi:hypothetical protein
MELDELKLHWKSLEAKLDRQCALDLARLRTEGQGRVRATLIGAHVWQIVQMTAGLTLAVLAGTYGIARLETPHLVVFGLVLHLYGILMIVAAAQDLRFSRTVDFTQPLVGIQRCMALWRRWRILSALLFGVLSCFAWIALVLVLFDALFGADIYANAPEVVAWFAASGVACLALMLCVLAYARRSADTGIARWLAENATGSALGRVQRELEGLLRFAQE